MLLTSPRFARLRSDRYDNNKDSLFSPRTDTLIASRWALIRRRDGVIIGRFRTNSDGYYTFTTPGLYRNERMSIALMVAPQKPVAYFYTGSNGNAIKNIGVPPARIGVIGFIDTNRDLAFTSGVDVPTPNIVVDVKFADNNTLFRRGRLNGDGVFSFETQRYPYIKLVVSALAGKAGRGFRTDGNGNAYVPLVMPGATIRGSAFTDWNNDDTQQPTEPIAVNTTFAFRFTNGSLLRVITTDALGNFRFTTVPYPSTTFEVFQSLKGKAIGRRLLNFTTDAQGNSPFVAIPATSIVPPPPQGVINGTAFVDRNLNKIWDDEDPFFAGLLTLKLPDRSPLGSIPIHYDHRGAFTFSYAPALAEQQIDLYFPADNYFTSFGTDKQGNAIGINVLVPGKPWTATTTATPRRVYGTTTATQTEGTTGTAATTEPAMGASSSTAKADPSATTRIPVQSSTAPGPGPSKTADEITSRASSTATQPALQTTKPPGPTIPGPPTSTVEPPSSSTYTPPHAATTTTPGLPDTLRARIMGEAWYDLNRNSLREAGEPAYAGRGISVQMGNGSTFVDGYTDSNGAFMEAVQVVIGMKLNAIADDGTRSRAFATDVRGNATFRLPIPPASIQGVLFFDLNENGKKDPTEPWASGTVFEVTKLDGTSLGKVTTNVTGGFLLFQAAFPDESLYLIGNPNRTVYSNFATDEKGNAVVIVPIKPGHVSGAVYWDFNNNGVKDGDEPDAANVSIVIKFANGTVVGTAMSDAQGIFDTAVIAHRNATLVVVAGRNKVVREFSTDSDGSAQLSLGMPGAMIQGVGWYDWNKNGVRDPTEWTLDGTNFLEIKYLASRQLLARLTPNDTGGFSWSGVPSPNTGFVIVGQQNVDLKVFFTDAEGSANLLVPILPSRLSGRQYYDLDRNGNWTAGIDKGVANQGFLVLLTDGELYVNVTTGADGGFFVEPPGPMFNEPMTLVLASDPTVVVRSFQTDGFGNVDLNMPLEPADITGIAWMDVNRDGVQDQAEPPLNNSAVDIMWPNGTLLVRALTDADGAFHATTVPFPGQNFTVFTPSGSPVTTFLTDGNGDATLKVAIPPPLISGKLWYSAKGSGAFDPSTDMALADKALQLRFPNSTAYLNFTTDPNGEFMLLPFNVAPRVSVAVIDPTSPTTPLGSITLDQYGSGRVELPLAVPPQYIYVNVWFDANSDLVYNSGDTPYRLKVMQLVFANGTVYGMGTTLANGTLVFKVGVVERHALLKVVPADDTTMVLGSFTTTILGGAVHDIALPLPTFSGQVFYDFDGNKNYSNGDVPMSTEMIMFMLPNGVAQSNTTTLADGTFNTITSPSVGLTLTVVRASAKTVVLGAFKTDPLGRAVITLPLPPGVIRGQAFFDLNKNGVQDFGEPPLSTSSLNLAHPDGSILAALQTNTSGGFKHTMVPLPNQPLSVVVGSSMILTNFTTLATGDANIAVAIPAPKISGQLWWDFVQDGKYDAAKDQGVVNERLLLLLANGTQYANTSTLMDGAFTFTSSRPMINSIMTIVKASNPAVVLATITTDEIGTLVGVVIPLTPGVIEGYAWVDVNKNDVRDPGEPPLNNSFIDVKSTNGTMFVRIPTDATGTYKAPVPAFPNHNFTLVLSSGSPVKSITTDGQGSSNAPVAIPPPFITLKMFYDGNNNSLWEADRDVVLPGRKLVLKFAGNGTMYTNVTTDPNGEFTYLPDVAAPNFRLNVFDSADVFKILGTIVLDSFGSGHVDLPVPPPPPFINATVWFDMNNNGARDSTDVPYGNMPIALIDSNGTVYLSGTMLANGSISFPVTSPLRSTKLGLVSLDDPATIIAEMTTDNLGSAAVSAPLPVPVISGQAVVANLNVPATNVEFLVLFANGSTYAKITSDSAGAFFYITTSPRPVTNFTVALASNPSVPIDSVRTDGLGNAANLEITLAPGTIRGDVCLEVRVDGVCDSNDVPYTSPVDLVRASDGSVVTRLTLEANGTFEYVMVPQFKANFSIIGPDGRLLKSISTDGAGNAVVQVPIIPGRLVADVFYDISGNGVRETGEPGYVARPVDIQYANGTLFATMTTNSTGGFSHPIYPQPSTIFFIVTSGRCRAGWCLKDPIINSPSSSFKMDLSTSNSRQTAAATPLSSLLSHPERFTVRPGSRSIKTAYLIRRIFQTTTRSSTSPGLPASCSRGSRRMRRLGSVRRLFLIRSRRSSS